MKAITPCLWFDTHAEEAARFYVSVFKNAKLGAITHYSEVGFEVHQQPAGKVMTVELELNGQPFLALNGGPLFKFTEAISRIVPCDTHEDIDYYWDKLGEGGDPAARECGWLKDKYGLSWQVAPAMMPVFLKEPARAGRVMAALLQMKKIDLATLQNA